MNRSRFGTVSDGTNQQALASLSWLSYSRPSDFPTVPEPVRARSHASPRCELPTLARLNEPDGTLTRIARCKSHSGSNPLDGICTHFDYHDPAEQRKLYSARRFSVAPSTKQSDRTRRLDRKRMSILGITSASLRRAWRTTLAVPCSTGSIMASGKHSHTTVCSPP